MGEKQYPSNIDRHKKRILVPCSEWNGYNRAPAALEYFEICKDIQLPWVLVTYLMHPEEDQAKKAVNRAMESLIQEKGMPNILYVPNGSPTSFEKKHTNGCGHDLNWAFIDINGTGDDDPEVAAWKQLLNGKTFDYSLHFHHDCDMYGKYYYAYCHQQKGADPFLNWDPFVKSLLDIGFKPYADQYDDLEHPALRNWIPENGLITMPPNPKIAGSFEDYLVAKKLVRRGAFTLELSNGLSEKDYNLVVKKIFSGLLDRKRGIILPTSSSPAAASSA